MQHEKLMESLIVKDFRSFYEEIVRLKARALSGDFIVTDVSAEGTIELTPATLCQQIQGCLLELLKEQKDHVERHGGGFAVRYYTEAQYVMTALSDEIFLNMDWVGRDEWKNRLLESQLFHTQIAGEKFFTDLDQFLALRDSTNSDIGVVYIFALGLGFKGRYRDVNDRGALKKYRDQLQMRVMRGSLYAAEEDVRLFPDAYAHNITTRDPVKVPSVQKWILGLMAVIAGYMALAYLIWIMHVGELEIFIDQIAQWMKVQ
jgi:type VI secretion system protein ImpK